MAASLDLQKPAERLIALGLVSTENGITVSRTLQPFTATADRPTLYGIARILLLTSPPTWLRFAVTESRVNREYIPLQDLTDLAWLGEDLDPLLIEIYRAIDKARQDDRRKQIGEAAELLLMSAFAKAGRSPVHVAKMSDAYGYDIECLFPLLERIEVKAASENTKGRFHITRNEYEKSCQYNRGWKLVQVVFRSSAFVATRIDSTHVSEIVELVPSALASVIPPDTAAFRWSESAELSIDADFWIPSVVELEPDWSIIGFISFSSVS